MAFSVLDWIIGESLNLAVSKASGKTLITKLDRAVDEWTKSLPADRKLVSTAMYVPPGSDYDAGNTGAQRRIARAIELNELPSITMLQNALFEHWSARKNLGAAQPFFVISDEEAKLHLADLAERFELILAQEDSFFNLFVKRKLEQGEKHNEEVRMLLLELKAAISAAQIHPPAKSRSLRPLPTAVIPHHHNESVQEHMHYAILKLAFYRIYHDCKYKKFTCVISIVNDAFVVNGIDTRGLRLFSGEIGFIAECQRLTDIIIYKPEEFADLLKMHLDLSEFKAFNFKYSIYDQSEILAYDVEVDSQTKKFDIHLSKTDINSAYANICSFNAALVFICTVTSWPLAIIDFDKLRDCPAIMKVVYCMLYSDKLEFDRFRINVEDFDDWDFEYTIPTEDE